MITHVLSVLLLAASPTDATASAEAPAIAPPRTITGDEPWLAADEASRRGLTRQLYYELFDHDLHGLESVCPRDIADRARILAAAAAAADADGNEVLVLVDGSEDLHEFDPSVAALLRRSKGADLPQLMQALRSIRAQARAECVRQALWSAGVTASITIGPPRIKQADGRRGAVVYLLIRERLSRESYPHEVTPCRSPESPPTPPLLCRNTAPATPPAVVTPPLARDVSRGRFGVDLQAGYLAAERTHFWASGGWLAAGLTFARVPLRRAQLRLGLGYFYADGATHVEVDAQPLPEFTRHHAGTLRLEVSPIPRFSLGVRVHAGIVREILNPGTADATQRGLFAVAAGPGLALRLFHNERWEGHLRYDFMLVAGPHDVDRGLGRLHLIGVNVAFLPVSLGRKSPRGGA